MSFGQIDTLIIDKYKYPLRKVKTHFKTSQEKIPTLPSEYLLTENKKSVFNYKCKSENPYYGEDGEDGIEIMVLKGLDDPLNKCKAGSLIIETIVDSISFQYGNLERGAIFPYIKTKNKNYQFCSAKFYRLKNDTLNLLIYDYFYTSLYFNFDIDNSRLGSPTGSTFILTDLYYKKGQTIYFLDKSFIIYIQ